MADPPNVADKQSMITGTVSDWLGSVREKRHPESGRQASWAAFAWSRDSVSLIEA